MQLVYIEWVDSHAGSGWKSLDEAGAACAPVLCRSVGWLLRRANRCHTVVPNIAGDATSTEPAQGLCEITIPDQNIRVIRRMSVGRRFRAVSGCRARAR